MRSEEIVSKATAVRTQTIGGVFFRMSVTRAETKAGRYSGMFMFVFKNPLSHDKNTAVFPSHIRDRTKSRGSTSGLVYKGDKSGSLSTSHGTRAFLKNPSNLSYTRPKKNQQQIKKKHPITSLKKTPRTNSRPRFLSRSESPPSDIHQDTLTVPRKSA